MDELISKEALLRLIETMPSSPTTERENRLINAFITTVEDFPTADVRPVVVCADCEHNNHCLTQEFVDDCGKIPLDRNTFFCADGERKNNA